VSFRNWLSESRHRISEQGKYGALKSFYWLYVGAWLSVTSRRPVGTNIYEEDWDALLILDGCRVDLLSEVTEAYPFLSAIETRLSVGSMSSEWLANTFRVQHSDEIRDTAYVTANPFTEDVLAGDELESLPKVMATPFSEKWNVIDESDLELLDEVWRDCWDDDLGTVPPRSVTDRAIKAGRNQEVNRLIVHYMQPHQPFLSEDDSISPSVTRGAFQDESQGGNVWESVRSGEYDLDTVWQAYRANLELVLEDVSLLLQNLDAETVIITADHGNAVGEWSVYGHPVGFLHPAVKRVPWVKTSADDTWEYQPDIDSNKSVDSSVEDRLQELGYL